MKCSNCQRIVSEYYIVENMYGKTHYFCYDCWKSISDHQRNKYERNEELLAKISREQYSLMDRLKEISGSNPLRKTILERLKELKKEWEAITIKRPFYKLATAKYISQKVLPSNYTAQVKSGNNSANSTFSMDDIIHSVTSVLNNDPAAQIPSNTATNKNIPHSSTDQQIGNTNTTPVSDGMPDSRMHKSGEKPAIANGNLHDIFSDVVVFKTKDSDSLFRGRNLPSFVKDYIIRRFSNIEGKLDGAKLKDYLESKMPLDKDSLKNRLLRGEQINLTTRVVFKTNIREGKIEFELPDFCIINDAYVSSVLIEKATETIFDGEQWGNMTISYTAPEKRQKGYVSMTSFKPFEPYKVNLDFYREARRKFNLEEWLDALVCIMGYDAAKITDEDVKLEYISRLLPFVEPCLNVIELGPKSTGKSHLYNNLSKRGWCISGGKISRAKLFYNKSTRRFGLLNHYDVVSIDEISTFSFVDPDEMQSAFKAYLEAGKCTVDNTNFLSECGLVLMGNIQLDENHSPTDTSYYKALPEMLRESATLDRFHSFIEGWKLPRLEIGLIHEGWALDAEYFSSILHALRSEGEYASIFDEIVEHDSKADLRDLKAVKKTATAYSKLLFPHVQSIHQLTPEALIRFKETYDRYCLRPAVKRRGIIRQQCHLIDREYSEIMPDFKIKV